MENHPIPQDITGFQFKLIGDMTIKQFAYLAAGIILGWITYILPIFIVIKIPILVTFVGLGIAAAFLPIEGRPFDVMIGNYFKALFSPTQYIYQKIGGHIWFPDTPMPNQKATQTISSSDNAESSRKLKEFLKSLPQKPKNKLDEKEMNFLNSLGVSPTTAVTPVINTSNSAYEKIVSHQAPLASVPVKPEEPKEPDKKEASQETPQPEKLPADMLAQKQNLENQILEMKNTMEVKSENVLKPEIPTVKPESQTVRTIPREMGKTAGLPFMSDVPNLIMGIIKGPRENPLSNILVEVKDESGNPVRAFKTNALGQFASATPLGNGTYTMSFEDPKSENKFDIVEIKATGEVLMPLEVISLDQREELRRSLFNPAQKS